MYCEFEFGVFIKLMIAHECQKQLLMSSISNLSGRESLEIAVNLMLLNGCEKQRFCHVVCFLALEHLNGLLHFLIFSCEYKYVELI